MDTPRPVNRQALAVIAGVIGVLFLLYMLSSCPEPPLSPAATQSPQKNADILRDMLDAVSRTLRQRQIPHWIIYHALRGWQRNKRISPSDYDVDIGTLSQYAPVIVEALVGSLPGQLYSVVQESDYGIQVVHTDSGMTVEFTQYNDEGGTFTPKTPCEWMRRMYNHRSAQIPSDHIFPIRRGELEGIDVPIPADPEALLQNWYG